MNSPEMVSAFANRASLKSLQVGWLGQAAAAFSAVVLSIIGLAGGLPTRIAAIAVISLGAAMLFEGVGLALSFAELAKGQVLEWGGATVGKWVGGVGGILVGALVLVGAAAPTLLPVAVLIFGAAFLFTSMISCVPTTQEIVGAIAFGLGLLAISGLHTMTLALVALLILGITTLFNDATSESKISSLAHL